MTCFFLIAVVLPLLVYILQSITADIQKNKNHNCSHTKVLSYDMPHLLIILFHLSVQRHTASTPQPTSPDSSTAATELTANTTTLTEHYFLQSKGEQQQQQQSSSSPPQQKVIPSQPPAKRFTNHVSTTDSTANTTTTTTRRSKDLLLAICTVACLKIWNAVTQVTPRSKSNT